MSRRWWFWAITFVGLLLTTIIVAVWGEWIREGVLRPLAVGWLWVVFYVTHLPQWAVWFFALAVLALVGVRVMPVRLVNPLPRFGRSEDQPLQLGPVSGWQREVELALNGAMYRRKLHRALKAALGPEVSAHTQQALDALDAPHRCRPHPKAHSARPYLENLNTVMDALEKSNRTGGAQRATE